MATKKLDKIKEDLQTKDETEKTDTDKTEEKPTPKPRRKRRAKRPVVLPPESTTNLLDVIFKVVAARAGEHWILTPEESLAGAQAFNAVAVKWVPTVVKYQEEAALATWVFMVLMPRLDLDALIKKVKPAEEKPAEEKPVEEKPKPDKPLTVASKK